MNKLGIEKPAKAQWTRKDIIPHLKGVVTEDLTNFVGMNPSPYIVNYATAYAEFLMAYNRTGDGVPASYDSIKEQVYNSIGTLIDPASHIMKLPANAVKFPSMTAGPVNTFGRRKIINFTTEVEKQISEMYPEYPNLKFDELDAGDELGGWINNWVEGQSTLLEFITGKTNYQITLPSGASADFLGLPTIGSSKSGSSIALSHTSLLSKPFEIGVKSATFLKNLFTLEKDSDGVTQPFTHKSKLLMERMDTGNPNDFIVRIVVRSLKDGKLSDVNLTDRQGNEIQYNIREFEDGGKDSNDFIFQPYSVFAPLQLPNREDLMSAPVQLGDTISDMLPKETPFETVERVSGEKLTDIKEGKNPLRKEIEIIEGLIRSIGEKPYLTNILDKLYESLPESKLYNRKDAK
jgi:hypothetical protein